MMTLLKINHAINNAIKETLNDMEITIPIVTNDVLEPIARPSIKLSFENGKNGKLNNRCREKSLTCRIYYFPKDRNKNKFDILQMQDLIEQTFIEGFYVEDSFYIPIETVESTIIENILICSFNISMFEIIEEMNEAEYIEEIKYK